MADNSETSPTFARTPFANGASIGVGSLPHTDSAAASAFSIGEFEIATVPTLPKRSASAGMLAQAATLLDGVEATDRGLVAGAPTLRGGPGAQNLDAAAFADLAAFLELGRKVNLDGAPVKWQFVGPITVGCALVEAGMAPSEAFALAVEVVDTGVRSIEASIAAVLPNCEQLVLLDEPRLVDPYDVGKDAFHHWREDDWQSAVTDAVHLYPSLKGREYITKINGMFVFSIDGFPMMGPTQVPGFWTAVGSTQ